MRPDEKELFGNVLRMSAVAWFVHTFVETPLHEFGHYWAASLLGVHAVIDGEITVGAAVGQVLPPVSRTLFFLAGGLCAGSLLLVLSLLMKKPYRYGLFPLVAAEFAYAPFDATTLGYALGLAALLVVWGLIFGGFLARFLGRGKAELTTGNRGRKIAILSHLRILLHSFPI